MGVAKPAHPELQDLLAHSKALLTQANKTIYFVNVATLLEHREDGWHPREAALQLLKRRLIWLDSIFPSGHQVLIHLSRVPPPPISDDLPAYITRLLSSIATESQLHIKFVGVDCRNHISPIDNSLEVDAIVATLISLFKVKKKNVLFLFCSFRIIFNLIRISLR